jgi:basic membrane protein A
LEEERQLTISKRLLGLGASAAMVFAACGPGTASTTPATQAPPAATAAPGTAATGTTAPASQGATTKDWKACVAFDTGGLGDKGFNDLAKKGLDDAAAAGYQTAYAEAASSADFLNNIQTLIDQKCQTIVAVGFLQGSAVAKATLANPTIGFAQVDGTWNSAGDDFIPGNADDPPPGVPANFTGLDYQVDQASMLAGYLAAGWTKTGKIGTYGGLAFPGVTRFMDGLYAGIAYYNQKHSTTVTLLGWDAALPDPVAAGTFVGGSGSTDTWNDTGKGEQFAQTFLDQGVDIVQPVAGETGNGTIKAMSEAGKYAIGVDTDQYISIGGPTVKALLTSAQKAIDVSVLDVINKNAGGDLGGEDYSGTIRNNGVLLAPYHDYDSQFSAELKAEVETLKAQLTDGTVNVCRFLASGC